MIVDDIYKLNWTPTSVESYDPNKNEAIIVFNFDIRSNVKIEKVLQFASGRIIMIYKNFPENVKISVTFDMRGQDIILSYARSIKSKLCEILKNNFSDKNLTIDLLI
jgi:hypothetical protein